MTSLLILQARWQLGFIQPHQVPAFAMQLLEQGEDDIAIAELATLDEPTYWYVKPLIAQALRTAKLPPLTNEQAMWVLVKDAAHRIVSGEVPPFEGAREIADVCVELRYPDALLGIYNLWDEYKQGEHDQFDEEIREEAATLLAHS